MVQELRRIILDKEEFLSALDGHRRMAPHFLPVGKISDFEAEGDSDISVTVQGTILRLTADRLLAAVVRFCIENNIMLPRDGRKYILVAKDHISLCISLDIATMVGGAEPMRLLA